MPGLDQCVVLSHGKNPIKYAAGCRGALCVPVSGGETLVVVSGVLRDIGVTHAEDILLRGQGCELVVWGRGGGLRGRGEVGVLRGGGE